MNDLVTSLLLTKKLIFSKKLLFLGLFLLQLLFAGLFLTISAHYQLLIFEDLQDVINPLQKVNFDQTSLEAGNPFIGEMLPLLQGYNRLIRHAYAWIIWLIALFLSVNGWIWLLSFNLIRRTTIQELLRMWLKFIVAGGTFVLLLSISIKLLWEHLFLTAGNGLGSSFKILGVIIIVFSFLLWLALAVVNYTSWKQFGKKIIEGSINLYSFIPLFIFLIGLILSILYLMFKLSDTAFTLVIILGLLALLLVAIARIFWILAVNKDLRASLEQNTNEKHTY